MPRWVWGIQTENILTENTEDNTTDNVKMKPEILELQQTDLFITH